MTGFGSLAQLLTILSIFVLVLLLAWFSARLVARYNRMGVSANGNLEVVEAFRLSQTQVVEILRIGERYVAVAVSKDHVERLGEWSREELGFKESAREGDAAGGAQTGFRALLEKYGKRAEDAVRAGAAKTGDAGDFDSERSDGPGKSGGFDGQ